MNPPHGGSPGQIVEHGADVARLSVVSSSVTDLLEEAVLNLDPSEENRYQRSERDGSYRSTVYFDMDWRNQPYDEQAYQASIPQMPAEYQMWADEMEAARNQEQQRFAAWLEDQDLEEQNRIDMQHWSSMDVSFSQLQIPPDHVVAAMQAFAQSQGQAMIDEDSPPDDAAIEQAMWLNYYMSLAGNVINSNSEHGKHISSTIGHGLERQQAITLYHRYMLETGNWTQSDYDIAEQLRSRFGKLKMIEEGQTESFSMQFDQTVLSICHSTFDPDTYKSTDHCEKIDISEYRR